MPTNPIRQSSPSAREGKVLAGCLIALGVAIVLAVIATVILFQYRRTVFVSAINVFADKAIAQMPIDQTERDEVRTELDGLLDLYKTKQIDRGQLSEVFEAIAECLRVAAADAGREVVEAPLAGLQFVHDARNPLLSEQRERRSHRAVASVDGQRELFFHRPSSASAAFLARGARIRVGSGA